jgi:predicted Zn-dependent protease with MMP-like domain
MHEDQRVSSLDDDAFEALEDEVDRLAVQAAGSPEPEHARSQKGHRFDPAHNESDFEALVQSALTELPADVQRDLDNVAIVVSDDGAKNHAYGLYRGIQLKHHRDEFLAGGAPDQIVIYRDTLVRDFGHDPDLLRAQVVETVRHEVGHHLGFDEDGVRRLGL